MNDDALRKALLELLAMGGAHLSLDQAIAGLDADTAFRRPVVKAVGTPEGATAGDTELHSAWELLEHMRLAQEDILRYTLDASWRSPPFPEGLWPQAEEASATAGAREQRWQGTLDGFREDLEQVRSLVRDASLVLTDEIPHGEGRTFLRQILLVADHNGYHLGQIVSVRRQLGLWPTATVR